MDFLQFSHDCHAELKLVETKPADEMMGRLAIEEMDMHCRNQKRRAAND
jgi:hypothetical protein